MHLEARLEPRRGSFAAKAVRSLLSIAAGLLTNDLEAGPSGLELVVSRRGSNKEVMRLIAGTPEEADLLLQRTKHDLARMSVLEFVTQWADPPADGGIPSTDPPVRRAPRQDRGLNTDSRIESRHERPPEQPADASRDP